MSRPSLNLRADGRSTPMRMPPDGHSAVDSWVQFRSWASRRPTPGDTPLAVRAGSDFFSGGPFWDTPRRGRLHPTIWYCSRSKTQPRRPCGRQIVARGPLHPTGRVGRVFKTRVPGRTFFSGCDILRHIATLTGTGPFSPNHLVSSSGPKRNLGSHINRRSSPAAVVMCANLPCARTAGPAAPERHPGALRSA
jgi:hypothetical protein